MGDTDLSWSVWVLEEGCFGGVEVEKMCHFLHKNPKKQINRQEKHSEGKLKSILKSEQATEQHDMPSLGSRHRDFYGHSPNLHFSCVDSDEA